MATQLWLLNQFGGGLNEKPLMNSAYTPDCRNVIARVADLLEKRKGQKRLNVTALPGPITGAGAFYYGPTRLLIVTSGGAAYQYNWQTSEFTLIKDGISQGPVQFVMGVNFLIAFDGETQPWRFDGLTITDVPEAPQDGWLVELYREKFFTVRKGDPSTLIFSESFRPDSWPIENFWAIGDGDGDEIRAVKHYKAQDHLVIFKENTVWALRGTNMDDMELSGPMAEPGCVGPNAVVEDGGYLYYIARDGIYRYNGYRSEAITRNRIPNLWKRISEEHLANACAGKYDGLIWFSLPLDDDHNNLVLVFDTTTGAIWPWDGINASVFLHFINEDDKSHFLSGSSVDGYMVEQDTGTEDFGKPIAAYYRFAATSGPEPNRRKKLLKLIINADPESGAFEPVMALLGVDPYLQNENTAEPQLIDLASPDMVTLEPDPIWRRFSFPPGTYCRYFQPIIYHYQPGRMMKVRSIEVQYKVQARW